jgi:hypothetical protein
LDEQFEEEIYNKFINIAWNQEWEKVISV